MKMVPLLALLFLLLCFCAPVSAVTVSFSNPTDLAERDLLMYASNGSYLATYNLTTVGIELPTDTDVFFVAKPHNVNPLTDPGDWVDETLAYFTTNVTGLIIAFALIAMLGSAVFSRR